MIMITVVCLLLVAEHISMFCLHNYLRLNSCNDYLFVTLNTGDRFISKQVDNKKKKKLKKVEEKMLGWGRFSSCILCYYIYFSF